MNRLSRENVQCIRARTLPSVIEMPSRMNRLARHRSNVVQMLSAENRAKVVVEMPAHPHVASGARPSSTNQQANSEAIYCGLRIAMMALAALFGWPHPTRDNDPGPASTARPWRLERLNVVGRNRAASPVAQLPCAEAPNAGASIHQSCTPAF
jgi:hypothetical protein